MPTRRTPITQAELARYLRAMRAAGFAEGRVVIEGPDGTRITVIAGQAGDDANDIDAMIDKVPHAPTS